MAETSKNKIYYNDDENSVADILADMKKLAESADNAIETKVDKDSGKKLSTNDFTNEYKNKLDELNNYDDTKIKEELEEVKEENTRLKEDLNALPTVQGNGEYVTLDTAECRFKNFSVEGKSEQETTEGKNLINSFTKYSAGDSATNNGITFTLLENGKIKVNGTAVGDRGVFTFFTGESKLEAGDYVLSYSSSKVQAECKIENNYPKVAGYSKTFSLTEDSKLMYVALFVDEGVTVDNETVYVQLEKGTTATDYELYTGGIASPNPKYPSKIRNVGDNINIFNKNMNVTTTYLNKTVLDTGVRITQTQAGNFKYLAFKIGEDNLLGKKLALSTKMQASANNQPRAVFYFGSPTSTAVQQIGSEQTTSGSTIINIPSSFPDGCDRIYLLLYSNKDGTGNVGDYVDYTDLKVEVGDKPTPYSDYNCGNISIKVQNENLFVTDFDRYMKTSAYRICPVVLEKGKKYRLSSKLVGEAMKNITVAIVPFRDVYNDFKLNMFITVNSSGNCVTQEFTVDETWTSPKLAIFDSEEEEFNNIFKNYQIMLEDITTSASSDYIKHQEQTKVFPLAEGQKLMKGDYLADDGIHYNRKQIVLDGSETWKLYKTYLYTIIDDCALAPTSSLEVAKLLSDKFTATSLNDISNKANCGITYNALGNREEQRGVCFNINDYFNSIDTLKSWLSNNPVTVEYELATEEIVPYTEEQQEQWEQLKNARSYEGQTHILSTDEISPDFNITARANLSEILNKLQGE